MSENDLGQLLRERLSAIEPPPMVPVDVLRRGRRARRLRAALAGGAAAVVVAAGAVDYGAFAGDEPAERASVVATEPKPEPVDVLVTDLAIAAFSPHVDPLPEPTVEIRDKQGDLLQAGAAGIASVQTIFELPEGGRLNFGANAGTSQDVMACADWKVAVSCQERELADGSTVLVLVLAFGAPEPGDPQLPTVLDEQQRRSADPDTLTWSRGVSVFKPDGDISGGFELVRAPAYAAAKAAWRVPTDALVAAATDPELNAYDFT